MDSFLSIWADDLFLHGTGLTRWITDYVDLEESMAVGSMSQEELAHAAALMGLDGNSPSDRDRRIYERPVEEWAPSSLVVQPAETWPEVVTRGFLFTEATLTLIERLQQSEEQPVSRTSTVIRAEQDLHARHWHRWVPILARDRKTADEFEVALEARADLTADLFGDPSAGEPTDLPLDDIHGQWVDRVHAALLALGVDEIPLPEEREPRKNADQSSPLAGTLQRVRAVRDSYPDRRYEVYS